MNKKKVLTAVLCVVLVICVAAGAAFFVINSRIPKNPAAVLSSALLKTASSESFEYSVQYSPLIGENDISGKVYKSFGETVSDSIYYLDSYNKRVLTDKEIKVTLSGGNYLRTDSVASFVDTQDGKYESCLKEKIENVSKTNSITEMFVSLFEVLAFFPNDFTGDSFADSYALLCSAFEENKNFSLPDAVTAVELIKGFIERLEDEEICSSIFRNLKKTKEEKETFYDFSFDLPVFIKELEAYLSQAGHVKEAEEFLALYGKDFDSLITSLEVALKLAGSKDTLLTVSFSTQKSYLTYIEIDNFFSAEFKDFSNALTREEAIELIKAEQNS